MQETITKEKIASNLQSQLGLSGVLCSKLVDSFFEEITKLTAEGYSVRFSKFGKFWLNKKEARPGFNIKESKHVEIEPRLVLRFSPTRSFKEEINTKLI